MATRRVFVGDFETTVYKGQTSTEVWASALVELNSEDVQILHSIDETLEYLENLDCNVVLYYHNLKFDGSFWLDFLINRAGYTQAVEGTEDQPSFIENRHMPTRSFKYVISDKGQWYSITIRLSHNYIEIRDSLKLLPFSVNKIGKSFGTKHKKLSMEYTGYRYAGCEITDEEKKYIANDVLVVKEALEIMFAEGHTKLTIGSCCLDEYRHIIGRYDFAQMFPNVYEMDTPEYCAQPTVGEYIIKSYRGGWCYLAKGKDNKRYYGGTTADVNSLYPSMMSKQSGNIYPYGKPTFWQGAIPDNAIADNKYYFVHIRTRFYLKEGYLPFVQIKRNPMYKPTECLETSDIYDSKTGKYYKEYIGLDGLRHPATVDMTLTMTDYKLLQEHYDLVDLEVVDGCWFWAMSGIFDDYIEKYKKIKMTSKGAKRELAKLFLNNLYGKMASTTNSSFKVAYEHEGVICYRDIEENDKKPGYIPIGSAITSYARNFTIRAAQKNYHGVDKPGFIYADTDSIHCDLKPEELVGVPTHDTEFCHWKLESCWDDAIFVRQKTYIEHVTHENLVPVDEPFYNVRCAGMNDKCKNLFIKSVTRNFEPKDYSVEENRFLSTKRTLDDFRVGLKIYGKLMPKRIPGGTLLVETTYEMR